ncbi:tripartite tricarboxylate transporter TctB family protein [Rhizobium sp. Root708]|uniref:tripartite tricarboxylate transporter TctB family protein n=1 Tax=Rhizobium sp. Root708 TaxID=1736592 RepID=UPI0009EB5CEC|nr:tripartite tricarboxylate transporter TctB family protein [Rhizobium sp. Root708]
MRLDLRGTRELWLGLIYASCGVAGVVLSRDYAFGTAARMGPGFFPTIISVLLLVFGVIAVVRSLLIDSEMPGTLAWQSAALIIGALGAFAYLIPRIGFVGASIALVLLCALASARFRLSLATSLAALALIAACVFVFIDGLGVQMQAFGPWLQALAPAQSN